MKKIIIIVIIVLALPFLWWTVSPLFITVEVQDDMPIEGEDTETSDAFSIQDTPAHPASGSVRVIQTAEKDIIRFENYDGTNGPDLRVYLANDLKATDFVDLGDAKGNKGNINYEIPTGVSAEDFKYVLTWCRAFGVLFDYAEIN